MWLRISRAALDRKAEGGCPTWFVVIPHERGARAYMGSAVQLQPRSMSVENNTVSE